MEAALPFTPMVRLALEETYRAAPAPLTGRNTFEPPQGIDSKESPVPVKKPGVLERGIPEELSRMLLELQERKPAMYAGLLAAILLVILVVANLYLRFRIRRAIRRIPWESLRRDPRIAQWPAKNLVRKLRLWDYLKDVKTLENLREAKREALKAKRKKKSPPLLLRKYFSRLVEIRSPDEALYVLKVMALIGNIHVVRPVLALLDQFPDDREIRDAIISVLRNIRDARLLREILPYLPKADSVIYEILVQACRSFGETGADILVRELGREKDPAVQTGILRLLGDVGGARIIPVLKPLLLNGPDVQRMAAADALAAIGHENVVEALVIGLCNNPSSQVREAIKQSLTRVSRDRAVEVLNHVVETSPTFFSRIRALEALEVLHSDPAETFFKALEADHPKVRAAAAAALERMGAIEAELETFVNEFQQDQQKFLVTVGKAGTMQPFLAALRTDNMKALKRVVRLLAMIGNREVIPELLRLLESTEDWTVQSRVIPALAALKATEAIPSILKHLNSTHHWVRKSAIDALGKLLSPISELRENTLPLLHKALADDDPWTRASAARVLSELEDRTSTPLLLELLDDSQTRVRVEAIRALKTFNAVQAEEKLIGLLDDPRQKVCAMAASALGQFASRKALPTLFEKFDKAKAMLRLAIIESVHSIDPTELDPLIKKLKTANRINLKVVRELNKLVSLDAKQLLLPLATSGDTKIRCEAVRGLAELEGDSVDGVIVAALGDSDESIRMAAVDAIALNERQGLGEFMREMRDDPAPEVRLRVLLAFGLVKDPEVLPYLRNCLYDEDANVNAHALMALFHYAEPRFLEYCLEKFKMAKVRRILKKMIKNGKDQVLRFLIEKIPVTRQEELMILRDHTLKSLDLYLEEQILTAATKEGKFKAIMIAEVMGRKRLKKPLKKAVLEDPMAEVRARALRAYSVMTNASCERDLIQQALDDPALEVQTIASRMLIHCRDSSA
jgi:HEAT repeat protein